jgi:hypothetical protein
MDRNLCAVIEQLLAVIPEDQDALRTKLSATRDSAVFAAPEVQSMWWNRSAELLREFVEPHVQLKTDWALKVVEIWKKGT